VINPNLKRRGAPGSGCQASTFYQNKKPMKDILICFSSIFSALSIASASPTFVTATWSETSEGTSKDGKQAITPSKVICEDGKMGTVRFVRDFIFPASSQESKDAIDFEKRELGLVVEITVSRNGDEISYKGRYLVSRFLGITGIGENDGKGIDPVVYRFATGECFFYGKSKIGAPVAITLGSEPDNDGVLHLTFSKEAEQDGTGQPATRSESKSEGSDKPQPEAEGRSR
jgi:hypothetical protein